MAKSKQIRQKFDGLHSDLRSNVSGDELQDEDMLRRAAAAIAVLGETFEKHAIADVEKMYRLFREGADVKSTRRKFSGSPMTCAVRARPSNIPW